MVGLTYRQITDAMAWFTADYQRFFKDLAAHNDRDWFHANKKRYETSVKKPFEAFVQELIDRMGKLDKQYRITPKEAIFRIHRDVRFSNDKTPYKLNSSALITAGGRKGMGLPGMYFELGPEHLRAYGGHYMPDKDTLYQVRTKIAKDPKAFRKLYEGKRFKELFGGVRGERNKVLPKEFKAAAEGEPLLFNKQFYYFSQLPAGKVTSPQLAELFMERFDAMRPMNDYLFSLKG
ncbi:MAG: DUF2461 domain-containing protein [Flavobacteriales bacterium]|nr:DUF2461 domain-containing protein [Flavobacteriales bacterium]MCB9200157.1 DUF2461 domain-containing protein [Flavobacteriales bacterium]HRW90575.1 DUF2461 domain-containing protein [Flavobacteriales bacterium]